MNEETAKKLIDKTKDDYNRIAADFSNKRKYLSQDIIALKEYAVSCGKILDLGCGNGRLVELFDDKVNYVGVDTSRGLIDKAREKYPRNHFMIIEGFDLPFPDNHFDTIFCLAVLHHIPGKNYRLKFLTEAKRVLKPGGKIIATVWNMWVKPGTKRSILKHAVVNFGKFDPKDILYPFKDAKGQPVVLRYIHCFTDRELVGLFKKAEFIILENRVEKRGGKVVNENLLIVAQRD